MRNFKRPPQLSERNLQTLTPKIYKAQENIAPFIVEKKMGKEMSTNGATHQFSIQ